MTNITEPCEIYAGVDTHHVAVIDHNGKHLADAQLPTTPAGYAALTARGASTHWYELCEASA